MDSLFKSAISEFSLGLNEDNLICVYCKSDDIDTDECGDWCNKCEKIQSLCPKCIDYNVILKFIAWKDHDDNIRSWTELNNENRSELSATLWNCDNCLLYYTAQPD